MTDEELKNIVREAVGNNDPYWNEPICRVVKKIIGLPENTETSIAQLIDGEYGNKAKFDIYNVVREIFEKLVIDINGQKTKIILDFSKHIGQTIGLPYNITFVIKNIILSDENKSGI